MSAGPGVRRWAVYARISDDREGAGLGVARQEKDCRGLLDRLGGEIVAVHADNDITAMGRKRRPAYEQMCDELRRGVVDGVLVWHTDRLHRTPSELEDYITLAEEFGFPTETVKAGLVELRTPAGRAMARTLCAWARYEVEHKTERVLAKTREIADAGRIASGGPRPFGYKRIYEGTGKRRKIIRDELHPVEAAVVREMAARVLEGESLRSLCFELNTRGITTTTGGQWGLQALRVVLVSARIAGLREHKGRIAAEAVWPAIVDRETWEQLRTLLNDPVRKIGHTNARKYALAGLLVCGSPAKGKPDGICGVRMRTTGVAAKPRFGCRPDPGVGCGRVLVIYEPLEELVFELFLRHVEEAEVSPAAGPDPADILLERIAELEKQVIVLGEAYGEEAKANPLELRVAGGRLRSRISEARDELGRLGRRAALVDLADVRAEWESWGLDRRRAALASEIERIIIRPATKRGSTKFDPDRVDIRWR